jgi:hypothetical protein
MAPKNPLAKITDAAQGAATLPLKTTEKVAERAVGVVAGGVRAASSVIISTAQRAKSIVGIEDEKDAPTPTATAVDAKAKPSGSSTPSRSSSSTSSSSRSFASPAPGPRTTPPAAPLESVEALAEAAVAREMAEEPLTTPTAPKVARATAPPETPKPKKVVATSTGAAIKPTPASTSGAQADDEPLIDPATAKTVKSETDILRAAADLDKHL